MEESISNTNLSKIQAIQQKRTLAFVNHFVMTNVQFLNNFMKNCEHKLMQFERKLDKVNAAMVLLESKLSSIPELQNIPEPTRTTKESQEPVKNCDVPSEQSADQFEPTEVDKPNLAPVSRPEYDRFIKMVQVGVPVQAVKLKLSLEGLDPVVLDELLSK